MCNPAALEHRLLFCFCLGSFSCFFIFIFFVFVTVIKIFLCWRISGENIYYEECILYCLWSKEVFYFYSYFDHTYSKAKATAYLELLWQQWEYTIHFSIFYPFVLQDPLYIYTYSKPPHSLSRSLSSMKRSTTN